MWKIGDYYEFVVSTTGLTDIEISWDQTGDNAQAPRDFALQYRSDSGFVTAYSYQIAQLEWSRDAADPGSSFRFDFDAIPGVSHQAETVFRLVNTSGVSVTGGGVGAVGNVSIDNVLISGTVMAQAMPEPTSLALTSLAAAAVYVRRIRRRQRVADCG
jgi:hypothetical protein